MEFEKQFDNELFQITDEMGRFLEESGFEDTSWAYDTCPSFERAFKLRIWIDTPNAKDSENRGLGEEYRRFNVSVYSNANVATVFRTNEWAELMTFVKKFSGQK